MSENILGGNVTTQFTYRPDQKNPRAFGDAMDAARLEQEAMVGYQLLVLKERSTKTVDAKGELIEVFVTFEPHPTPTPMSPETTPAPYPVDGTKA